MYKLKIKTLRTLILLFLLFTITVSFSQQEQIFSKAKITYNSPENFQKLMNAGIPMDHGQHKMGVFIISDFSEREIEIAKSLGVQVEILIEDIQRDFLERNALAISQKAVSKNSCTTSGTNTKEYPTPTNFKLGSMGGYLTYQEMLNNLDSMREKYPSLISARANLGNFVTNGTPDSSVSPSIGGNALQWVRISDNPDSDEVGEPEILYDAIHHAREPAGLSQLIYFMWYVLENYESDAEIKKIVDNTELYFVPVVNPDGYLYNQKTNPNGGGLWRKNRFNTHGVDLNRNYDHFTDGTPSSSVWGTTGTSPNTSSDIYPGTGAFSEVETQAMKWFTAQHDFIVALNNHTSGDLLLLPYGYADNKPTPDNAIYEIVSEEMVSQNGFSNIIASELYAAAGDSDDYMYGGTTQPHNKIFAFTPEIGPSFWPASTEIDGISKSMMHLNITAAKITHNYAQIKNTAVGSINENLSFNASYELKRLGLVGNGTFTVRIIPVSSNIESVGAAKTYANTTLGTSIDDSIVINLRNSIATGEEVVYTIEVDGSLFTESVTVTKIYGAFNSIVDINGNTLNDFTNSGWEITNTSFVSPGSSITESSNGNYSANQNKTIELSESINLENVAVANVTFYAKWDIEQNWDYTQFEVSVDGGATWVPQCGSYTNAGSSNNGQPTGEPLYDGTQLDWILEQIDLSDYLGQTIKLRFQFVSDGAVEADGFYFDDLKVNILEFSVLGVNNSANTSFTIFPNPTENIIKLHPREAGSYSLILRNAVGQKILSKQRISGYQEFDIATYPNGLYFLSISQAGNTDSFKIIKK